MAVAAPKRRSASQAAPAPVRTAPPEPKKRPRDRPRPGGSGRAAAPAKAPARKGATPKRKAATGRKAAAARAAAAPARRKAAPKRRSARVIPIAAGRAAVAVTQLPESGLIHRLTRGRAWIGVLGLLLVGIVALNVVTLSFAASSGRIDAKNTALSKENSMLQSRAATVYGQARMRHEAAALGLAMPSDVVPRLISARKGDVAAAAARLAAAASAAGATAAAASGEEATSEEAASGEEAAVAATGESEFTPEEEAIYNREWEELVAAEAGAYEAPADEATVTEYPTE